MESVIATGNVRKVKQYLRAGGNVAPAHIRNFLSWENLGKQRNIAPTFDFILSGKFSKHFRTIPPLERSRDLEYVMKGFLVKMVDSVAVYDVVRVLLKHGAPANRGTVGAALMRYLRNALERKSVSELRSDIRILVALFSRFHGKATRDIALMLRDVMGIAGGGVPLMWNFNEYAGFVKNFEVPGIVLVVRVFLRYFPVPKNRDMYARALLELVSMPLPDAKIIKLLIDHGVNPNAKVSPQQWSALNQARFDKKDDVLRQFGVSPYPSSSARPPTKGQVLRAKNVQAMVSKWKLGIYQSIGNLRQGRKVPARIRVGNNAGNIASLLTNRAIVEYMRTKAPRVPEIPPGFEQPQRNFQNALKKTGVVQPAFFLYRGMHGPQARALLQDGRIDLKSFVAFSRSWSVARHFATETEPGVVLRFRVPSAFERGTPWIWFVREMNMWYDANVNRSSLEPRFTRNKKVYEPVEEEEVLLPPGRITVGREVLPAGNGPRLFEATYAPDRTATSLFDGRRIVRASSSRLRNNSNSSDHQWNLFGPEPPQLVKKRRRLNVVKNYIAAWLKPKKTKR